MSYWESSSMIPSTPPTSEFEKKRDVKAGRKAKQQAKEKMADQKPKPRNKRKGKDHIKED